MGGYVLFALLRRHREKVRTALLMSTRATADDDSGRKVREAVAKAARRLGTGALFESHVDRVLAPRASPEVRAKLRAMFERTPGETCARDALAKSAIARTRHGILEDWGCRYASSTAPPTC